MPESYLSAALSVLHSGKEDIMIAEKGSWTPLGDATGWEHRENTLNALARFEQSQRLSKVLQMLPIVEMQLNTNQ
mgnify:CR=1 FL=1